MYPSYVWSSCEPPLVGGSANLLSATRSIAEEPSNTVTIVIYGFTLQTSTATSSDTDAPSARSADLILAKVEVLHQRPGSHYCQRRPIIALFVRKRLQVGTGR